jgi:hypothetical protein
MRLARLNEASRSATALTTRGGEIRLAAGGMRVEVRVPSATPTLDRTRLPSGSAAVGLGEGYGQRQARSPRRSKARCR